MYPVYEPPAHPLAPAEAAAVEKAAEALSAEAKKGGPADVSLSFHSSLCSLSMPSSFTVEYSHGLSAVV